KVPVTLALPCKTNIANALIATPLPTHLAVSLDSVASPLATMGEETRPLNVLYRSEALTGSDDTYKANVQSVNAALKGFSDMRGRRRFGEGELGDSCDLPAGRR
ncbi:UDP-N-acetylmuramoyl-tripeptide--D-alanyl-D-alanine ligase, partial [Pseudoalteromonas sp. S2721]